MNSLPDIAPQPLRDCWLDIAASQASTQWVKQFIQIYLPQLQQGAIQPDTIAALFDAELEQRKLTTPSQQKNYRSNLSQALKVIDPQHPAIVLVALSTEIYRELNDVQRGRLADRETKYFTSAAAQTLVDRATALLNSNEWSEVAAGLAVLMGRRISEVLLSRFAQHSDWSLDFSEMAKKAEDAGMTMGKARSVTIEIPTLAPAAIVLRAIDRLQAALRIDDLRLESVTGKGAKQRVNSRYSEPVARRCDQHFADLIPTRTDRENLYTHVFRGVYASIAAHWFCPPIVPEHNFKAEIQGHFTLSSTGQKLPNYSARANYDDYTIGTPDGNRDGRLGIKLGHLPGLQVIDAFRKPQTPQETQPMEIEPIADASTKTIAPETQIEAEPDELTEPIAPESPATTQPTAPASESTAMNKPADKRHTKRPEVYADDLNDMMHLMLQEGVSGAAADVFHALLEAFQQQRSNHHQQQAESVGEMGKAFNHLLDKIQSLEATVSGLEAERDGFASASRNRLKASQEQLSELQRLQAENDRLHAQVELLQAEMSNPRKMLERVLSQQTAAPMVEDRALPIETTSTISHSPVVSGMPQAIAIARTEKPAHRPAKAPKSDEPKSRNVEETKEKINHIIDAMISWNSSQATSSQMLAISIPAIKGIGRAIPQGCGAISARPIKPLFKKSWRSGGKSWMN